MQKSNLQPHHKSQINHVRNFLKTKHSYTFEIIDACRINNTGILNLDVFADLAIIPSLRFSCFIPAAGAATRYFSPLKEILEKCTAQQQVLPLKNYLTQNKMA